MLLEDLFDSLPEELSTDTVEELLRECLFWVTDLAGMSFQDETWWLEALALAKAMKLQDSFLS